MKIHGYTLVWQDIKTNPGRLTQFVAFDNDSKTLLIALCGSSFLADAATDCASATVPLKLPHPYEYKKDLNHTPIHEGFGVTGTNMTYHLQPLIEQVFLPLGFKVRIIGHSLGATVAATMALLLRLRIRLLQNNPDLLHAYGFAIPPMMGYHAALSLSPVVTSTVNNEEQTWCSSTTSCTKWSAYSDWSLFTILFPNLNKEKVKRGSVNHARIQKLLDDVLRDIDNEKGLYVPGRVIFFWKLGNGTPNSKGIVKREAQVIDAGAVTLRWLQVGSP